MLEADWHKSWTEGEHLNLGVGRGRSQAVDLEYGVIGGEAGMNYAVIQEEDRVGYVLVEFFTNL